MRILDRYVGRYFVTSLAICATTIALLFLLLDLVANLDDIVGSEQGFLHALAMRQATQLPLVLQRFGAFVTLAAALFTTARLQSNNELTPMLAAGVPTLRALAPVLVGAVLIGGFEAAITELFVPRVADAIRSGGALGSGHGRRPGFLRDDLGNTLFAGGYDPKSETIRWVSFRERGPDGRLERTLFGDRARWVRTGPRQGYWLLERGWERPERASADEAASTSAGTSTSTSTRTEDVSGADASSSGAGPAPLQRPLPPEGVRLSTTIEPIDVESLNERFSLLTFDELRRQAYERQTYLVSLRVQLLQRLTGPLAHVLLCLLGLPIVLGSEGRKSMVLGVLALLGICSLYFLTTFFFYELGSQGVIPPVVSATAPVVIAGLVALPLWSRVRT